MAPQILAGAAQDMNTGRPDDEGDERRKIGGRETFGPLGGRGPQGGGAMADKNAGATAEARVVKNRRLGNRRSVGREGRQNAGATRRRRPEVAVHLDQKVAVSERE
jgi:hypothetical protein